MRAPRFAFIVRLASSGPAAAAQQVTPEVPKRTARR